MMKRIPIKDDMGATEGHIYRLVKHYSQAIPTLMRDDHETITVLLGDFHFFSTFWCNEKLIKATKTSETT